MTAAGSLLYGPPRFRPLRLHGRSAASCVHRICMLKEQTPDFKNNFRVHGSPTAMDSPIGVHTYGANHPCGIGIELRPEVMEG